jgi:hypothetical protein
MIISSSYADPCARLREETLPQELPATIARPVAAPAAAEARAIAFRIVFKGLSNQTLIKPHQRYIVTARRGWRRNATSMLHC